jgi:hypothetical protein
MPAALCLAGSGRMDLPVASPAKSYEILFRIMAQIASRRDVVNFESLT